MDEHNKYIINMISEYTNKNYNTNTYDAYLLHTLGISDAIARGL